LTESEQKLHDKFTKFEASPLQYMVDRELELSAGLSPITDETSMICNL